MYTLERLSGDHLEAALVFELENRAYFARSLTDRGEAFYASLAEHHEALLAEQRAGGCAFYVLISRSGLIVGRFNLYDIDEGLARVGYRVAERVAGRGVATDALRSLCGKAVTVHGLQSLSAQTSTANVASQRVLEKAGFSATACCEVGGKPGLEFVLTLAG